MKREAHPWMTEPWTCPKCQIVMKASGKGAHSKWCGKTADLFWGKVEKTDSCWLFKGTISWEGYGRFNEPGSKRQYQAHRYAWRSVGREIPEGMALLHRCDMRNCVNPDHLYVGTWGDNMADKVARGRDPTANLNADQVREARRMLAEKRKQTEVARALGVSGCVINSLALGKTYRWVK